jgi:carbonic anhydrase/acetyltransferase-like protein (isoleucine patch superfamily)
MFNTRPWLYYNSYSNKYLHTYIQGILDICGNIVLRNGGFSLPEGDVSMNGNLYVGKQSTLIGDVSMNGNLYVGKESILIGDVSMNGNLYVGKQSTLIGDVSMNGNLYVGKESILIGDVSMNGNLYVGKQSTLIGDVSMNGNLYVGLDTLFNRNITINGTATLTTLQISNTLNASTIYLGVPLTDIATTLNNLMNDITTLSTKISNTKSYFVLVCEYNGDAISSGWFSFGANTADGNQVVMPKCTLIAYRTECRSNVLVNTIIVPFKTVGSGGEGVANHTLIAGTRMTQNTTQNIAFNKGNTFRVRFNSSATGGGGGKWRSSFIFSTIPY